MNNENEIVVDDEKVKRLMRKIVMLENQNLKTHTKTDMEMVKLIRNTIEEEVRCY